TSHIEFLEYEWQQISNDYVRRLKGNFYLMQDLDPPSILANRSIVHTSSSEDIGTTEFVLEEEFQTWYSNLPVTLYVGGPLRMGNTNIQFRTSDGGGSGVNGLLSMTADGAASSDVTTELGDTEIVLRSADMLGNEAIRTIKVIYDID